MQAPEGEFFPLPFVGWKVMRLDYLSKESTRGKANNIHRLISVYHSRSIWSQVGGTVPRTKKDDDRARCDERTPFTWKQNDEGHWWSKPSKKKPHFSPDLDCMCGWHSYCTLQDCWDDGDANAPTAGVKHYRDASFGRLTDESIHSPFRNAVLALVWAWGDPVWIWDNTARSTHMKIAALCKDSLSETKDVTQHAKKLDVPVLTIPEMKDHYKNIGIPLGGVS